MQPLIPLAVPLGGATSITALAAATGADSALGAVTLVIGEGGNVEIARENFSGALAALAPQDALTQTVLLALRSRGLGF